jgi:uncharacterized membrane protein YcaP (DUF421 family)
VFFCKEYVYIILLEENMEILQIALTSAASLAMLFLLTKLMGNKQVSQLTMLDYIIGISIGSIAAEMATDLETPTHSLTAMITYGVIAAGVSLVSQRSLKARKIMSGKPLILLDNGKIYRKNMKKGRIDLSEFLMQCRSQGYFDISLIQTAVMEFNGNISILPLSTDRPVTPADIELSPQQEKLTTAVIMDGHVDEKNLKITGNNEIWLTKQLHEQGYNNPSEVFLAMCDSNNKLTIFAMDND